MGVEARTRVRSMVAAVGFVAMLLVPAVAPAARMSDARIRRIIVQQSIASYPGRCPCPYSRDRAGRRCGRRSAYVRAGGFAPVCYPHDVPEARIRAYRRRHPGAS